MNIGSETVRVGLVEFANLANGVFNMNHYYNKRDLRASILNTPYLGGGRNISGGLSVMHNQQYTVSCGDRPNVGNFAIVITDGKANVDQARTIPEAISARGDGIEIVSVGISNEVDVQEISQISSIPQQLNQNYFLTENYQTLDQLVNIIAQIPCTRYGKIL